VLVRVDYNCPTDDVTQTITDTARIDTTVPSLQAIFEVRNLFYFICFFKGHFSGRRKLAI
jgi:3-phosphoglycerate kinase